MDPSTSRSIFASGVDHFRPSKVVLGMPFYGHGWRTTNVTPGLCLAATGMPRGTFEKGLDDYEVLAARNAQSLHDEKTGTHWTFDGSTFWSFDDPLSASWRADYANCRGLRGMALWELSGDDLAGSLLAGMSSQLWSSRSACHKVWPPLPRDPHAGRHAANDAAITAEIEVLQGSYRISNPG